MAIYPSLSGMAVFVSGGADGIGAAIVEAFCAQGSRVGFVDIDGDQSQRTTDSIARRGATKPLFEVCDLRNIAEATAAFRSLEGQIGPFRSLINNAGNDEAHEFGKVDVGYFDDRVAVNFRHQFFLAQLASVGMTASGGGSIVNLGSTSWRLGSTTVPVYAAMKSAVHGLTKVLARDLGSKGIRVNAVEPGWILTRRQHEKASRQPEKSTQYLERQCLKEHLVPNDIAEIVLWLSADESAHCTAQIFAVDGGLT